MGLGKSKFATQREKTNFTVSPETRALLDKSDADNKGRIASRPPITVQEQREEEDYQDGLASLKRAIETSYSNSNKKKFQRELEDFIAAHDAKKAAKSNPAVDPETVKAKKQAEAAEVYKSGVNATLDPVAEDFKTFAQQAQVTSNVDPAFRDYQLGLAAQLQQQATGQGPSIAQLQLQQATDRTLNQTAGAIRSATGANAGLAARTAALAGAQGLGSAGNQSAILRLQEQQLAQQNLGIVAGQGRGADIDVNGQTIDAQMATNTAKLAGLQGLAGIRTTQAAPNADIYSSNGADGRQQVQIQADVSASELRAARDREAARIAKNSGRDSQIWGAVLQTGGTILGGMYGGPAGAAAGSAVGSAAGNAIAPSKSTYGNTVV